MIPHWSDDDVTLYAGDCLDVLRELPDASVDAVVTDPPYGLEFMGQNWDKFGSGALGNRSGDKPEMISPSGMKLTGSGNPTERTAAPVMGLNRGAQCRKCNKWRGGQSGMMSCQCESPDFVNRSRGPAFQQWCESWAVECLRVLKPGGHLLAFGGTRTWHRLACAIEDAGFEVRDSIAWLYGSGFPKSLDVGKAIDRAAGVEREVVREWTQTYSGGAGESAGYRPRNYVGRETTKDPATDDARTWQGWGTALKPAHEPIVVARKPVAGTVAANVLAYGTGGINVDACRVGYADDADRDQTRVPNKTFDGSDNNRHGSIRGTGTFEPAAGRWPPNVLLGGPDAAAELDRQSGTLTSSKRHAANTKDRPTDTAAYGQIERSEYTDGNTYGDSGGASRFFPIFRYEAKAPTSERPRVAQDGANRRMYDGIVGARCTKCGKQQVNVPGSFCTCDVPDFQPDPSKAGHVAHPTVKPLALMRWLVRLVTPPGGTVLDPFAGSGTTGEAAIHEHMRAILIEREADYLPLIVARLTKPHAVGFDLEGIA